MSELPLGFGMALAQHEKAMQKFSNLSKPEKEEVIRRTKSITSKNEMKAFVSAFADDDPKNSTYM